MRARAVVAVLLAACSLWAGQKPEPELRPGQETRIDAAGGEGYLVVYVPTDYTPDRRWPVIFCYHGQNGKPTSYPFRHVLGGKGFVIVGMGYAEPGGKARTMSELDRYILREVDCFRKAAAMVGRRLSLDPELFFVGGFSMGGWMSSALGEMAPASWAGVAVLGAGRQRMLLPIKHPRAMRGKPIYIGCGTNDPNFPHAKKAASAYRGVGAKVTFEEYKGLGHQMKNDTKVLPEWLWANGPLKVVEPRLAAAREAEKAGRLGKAYGLYRDVAAVAPDNPSCKAAADAAKAIADAAAKQLAEVEKAIADKRYADASRVLPRMATRYDGSPFGERADALIGKLQSDPTIQGQLAQGRLDAEADALEAKARDAEKAKDYATAMRLYESYVDRYPKATRFATVKAHLDALKADKKLQATILSKQAHKECRVWLSLADNFLRAKRPDKAREYLEKIIDKYGETDWAAQAKRRLATME